MEIQEGKSRMEKKDYQELGSTAACMMRGVSGCGNYMSLVHHILEEDVSDTRASKRIFLSDSWFGSVNSCDSISKSGHHGCFIVKTPGYQKKFIHIRFHRTK